MLQDGANVRRLNVAAAQVAKNATAKFMQAHPGSKKFVAGAIGPTNKVRRSKGIGTLREECPAA